MNKIVVLGGGLVGRTIASDIQQNIADVTVLDSRELHYGFPSAVVDLSTDFSQHIKTADLVVNALPGFLGYSALQTVIKAQKNCVDISFFDKDPFTLDALAKENGVVVAVDCGVAPGMCNMILGYESVSLVQTWDYVCTVGGLPVKRTLPFQYKAPYSPSDVIEFYMRPARIKVNGKRDIVSALSDIAIEHTEVGSLESFNTDGLRTLLTTMPNVDSMKERTYRYPGHAQLISTLKDAGFFEKSVMESTEKVLRKAWKLEPHEEEFTIMKVVIHGDAGLHCETIEYNLLDRGSVTDSSMARSTGFTCNAVVDLIDKGNLSAPGVHAPEQIGMNQKNFESILHYLKQRNVIYTRTVEYNEG